MNKYAVLVCKLPFVLLQRMGIYALYNYVRLFFFFKKIKPDILHINNGGYPGASSCLVAVFSARLAGVKKIVFNVNNLAQKQKNVLERVIDKYIYRHVNNFITASALAGARLVENRRFQTEKIDQIFNVMQQEKVVKSRAELLRDYPVASNKFIIVCVALLTWRKGQMFLLAALNNIKKNSRELFENMFLFLVGDGEDLFKIESYLAENELTDNVMITGYRNDYYDFINAADLFVLPSIKDEDMPLVILSAMGLGKPIVSTKVAGIVEEIRDGVDGLLLEPSELHKLADVIVHLYHNRSLCRNYGDSALQRYRNCFVPEKIINQYLAIYNELLEEQR